MKYWLAFIGSSPFAVINTIWAACREEGYVPEHVKFLTNNELKEEWKDTIGNWVPTLLEEYGVKDPLYSTNKIEETNFNGIHDKYRSIFSEIGENDEVAVDITPGRKYMSAISMEIGLEMGADHVYYMHLSDNRYQNSPYPLIPKHRHTLIDLKKEFDDKKSVRGDV
ncbi:hypothetical protein [Methanohalophilus sp.]